MERLEKFIVQNREDFDKAVPSLKVWAKINSELEGRISKRVRMWKFMRIAAAVTVLLISGAVIGIYFNNNNFEKSSTLAEIAPEYEELEKFYTAETNQKIQQLAGYQHDVFVEDDLKMLDELHKELLEELRNAPKGSEEQIIQAMMNNYQTKINILERVLEKIQSTNQKTIIEGDAPSKKTEEDEVSI